MRRLLLAVSALAALILGLEKVGAYHFVPGGETGFECTPVDNRCAFLMRHSNSTGNLTTWVRLTVRTTNSALSFVPVDWTGDPLAIESHSLGNGLFELNISKKPDPPLGTPFVWGAGLDLQIADAGQSIAPILEDWAVYPSGQAPDSRGLATRRRQWTILSWILLPLAAIGAVLAALKETDKPERVTTRTLAIAIINDIVVDSPDETRKLRLFMRTVLLEDVPVEEALTKAGFKTDTWIAKREGIQFHFRAIHLFSTRVDNVVAEFDRYNQRLAAK